MYGTKESIVKGSTCACELAVEESSEQKTAEDLVKKEKFKVKLWCAKKTPQNKRKAEHKSWQDRKLPSVFQVHDRKKLLLVGIAW